MPDLSLQASGEGVTERCYLGSGGCNQGRTGPGKDGRWSEDPGDRDYGVYENWCDA